MATRRELKFAMLDEAVWDAENLLARGYERAGNWDLARCCHHLAVLMGWPIDGFPAMSLPRRAAAWLLKRTIARPWLRKVVKSMTDPVIRMVGKPAPPLPAGGWVGGKRPDLAGRPHLLHFWATSCGPCKNDLPRLRELAAAGAIVVGVHPAGTPPDEVAKAVTDQKLGYPTLVSGGPDHEAVAGYPVRLFPYCVVVDARGNVVAHGTLDQVLRAVGRPALVPAKR